MLTCNKTSIKVTGESCFIIRKQLLLFCLFLTSTFTAYVQNNNIDSLQLLLRQKKNDTSKVSVLLQLSQSFGSDKFDSSIYFAYEGLSLAQTIGSDKHQIHSLILLSDIFRIAGDAPRALQVAFQSLRLSESIKDTLYIIHSNRFICYGYILLQDHHVALQYARRNQQIIQKGFHQKAIDPNIFHFMAYANIMAGIFEKLNKMDSALHYRRLSFLYSGKDQMALSLANTGMGTIHMKLGNLDSALNYFMIANAYAKEGKRTDIVAATYLNAAKVFEQKQIKDSAFYYARLSLATSKERKHPQKELEAASLLHELYSKQQNIDSAYKYLNTTLILKDSLYNTDKIKQVEALGFGESVRNMQLEQAKKEARQQYANQVKLISLIAGIAILLLVAFILYRNNRQKEKSNLLLQETLNELKTTQAQLIQSEKMASLGELTAGIAHEIQNPLNFVTNFSDVNEELITDLKTELQSGNIEEAVHIAKNIEENEQKIAFHGKRADAIVKNMLQHARPNTGGKESINLNALVDECLRLSYHGFKTKEKSLHAKLETQLSPDLQKVSAVAQDISRVLINLFNNALYSVTEKKKQLNGGFEPVVFVSTKKLNGKAEVIVRDNGLGISESVIDKIYQPFFTTKPTGEGTGLGLSMSYDIIKAHGGEMKVETKEGEFAAFIVTLPSHSIT